MAVSTAIGAADLLRRDGQVRPGPAARLAAGRDGRPDAGQRADPRGDDGGGGRVPGGAGLSADGAHVRQRWRPKSRPRPRLQVVTWVGAITAVFAATIAVAQNDIKRILAYSTVSQLGYMMLGLGVGGVAVGMFHLITHAFFKALLFLGAGSVIHGCHEEQDIRRMGGLRKFMPVTFATYAVGMMALCGVPAVLLRVLEQGRDSARGAWLERVAGAVLPRRCSARLLTAFYMTRQVFYVFFGNCRLHSADHGVEQRTVEHGGAPPRSIRTSNCRRAARKSRRHDAAAGGSGGVLDRARVSRHAGLAVVSGLSRAASRRSSTWATVRGDVLR